MPKRDDIKTILIVGSGPIIIGQACEFDYSGTQACKALREHGYRVVLVNSNPATIMTDPEIADATYIEPVNWKTLEKIIAKEKPDAILPTMGGQTGLNVSLDLATKGILKKYSVEMIGANQDAIDNAEDREKFKKISENLNLLQPANGIAYSEKEANSVIKKIGFPAVIRPSYVLGGRAMEIVHNEDELKKYFKEAVVVSGKSPVLIDHYLKDSIEVDVDAVSDGKKVIIAGIM